MKNYEILERLVYANSPTGFEDEIQGIFTELISPYVDNIYEDNFGNIFGELKGSDDMPRVMINAHCDSIGFIVKYIGDGGFIYTQDLPGHITTDYRMLPSNDVLIQSRKSGKIIEGSFVPPRPIHKLDEVDLLDSENREELGIDIGAKSQEEAMKYVSIGDYITLTPNLKITSIGDRLVGTSLDDRLGLYCIVRLAEELSKTKKKIPTIIFTSTVCEENFIGAAAVAARNAEADIALTIDSTIATDQFVSDADYAISKQHGWVALDSGVALSRGFSITDKIFLELERICEDEHIPYQIDVTGGGSECEQIQPSGSGVKTALLSLPVRNLHTRVETASIYDVECLIKLAKSFINKFPKKLIK